jgi:hypothetical protein
MDDLEEWLSQGSRPEATVDICLVGDLSARHQAVAEELLQVASDPNRSIEDTRLTELGAELDRLAAEMAGHTRTFRLHALPVNATPSYLDLQVANPPRDGDEVDQRVGYNRDTFLPALVKACTSDPELSDEQWDVLLGKLSSRQWDELWVTAQQLNRQDYQAPKSLGISAPMPPSGAKSRRRGPSASRSNGSEAGSRPRRSNTTPTDG